ncbi:MAG: protein kinase domain-containing protein [Deltaproteobacteria bacterium]|jgi:serine/threonine protein kinase
MSSRSDPAAVLGSVLAGRYRLEAIIGAGGMAEVFRAVDLADGRVVAVKILRGQTASNREAVARLKREGEVLGALRHKSIVAIEAAHELEDGVFLVMELLEGETLGARMRRGRLSPAELAPIVTGVVAGLAAAHARAVVHRDLKPDNIFLVPDVFSSHEDAIRVKLLDFGISKVWYGEKLTQTGQVLGTPRYMSPEQLGAELDVDPRIDVYALGVILYEALAGTPPFLSTNPTDLIVAILHGKVAPLRSVRPDLSPAIEAVVMRAMARHRDARFASARELADAFLDAAGIEEQFRPAQRKGLETRALGSVRLEDEVSGRYHAELPPPDDVSSSAIKPGTFTELPAYDAAAPVATLMVPMTFDAAGRPTSTAAGLTSEGLTSEGLASTGLASTGLTSEGLASTGQAPMGLETSAPGPAGASLSAAARDRAIPRTSISEMPPSAASPMGEAFSAPSLAPARSEPHAPAAQTASMPPPARLERLWWLGLLAVGLVAGALTSGAVIALLRWLRPAEGSSPPPPPLAASQPDAGGASTDAAPQPRDATETVVVERGSRPSEREPAASEAEHGSDLADASAQVEAEVSDAGRRRTGRGGREGEGSEDEGGGSEEPTDPLSLATRALRMGDATACVDLLDDLIAQGATPTALRRRGDCLLRLGERIEAIRDYQRFCRLAPDHPAIAEVREVLEGLGQTCP